MGHDLPPGGQDKTPGNSEASRQVESLRGALAERDARERQLRSREQRWAAAAKMAGLGMWTWRPLASEMEWSEEIFDLLGYRASEISPSYEAFVHAFHSADQPALLMGLESSFSKFNPFPLRLRVANLSGGVRQVLAQGKMCIDPGTGERELIGTLQDVTALRDVTRAIDQTAQRLRLIVETLPDVFWLITPGLREVLYVSPGYERVWGRSIESLYRDPSTLFATVIPEDRSRLEAILSHHWRGEAYEGDYHIRRVDGAVLAIHERGFPIRDESGSLWAMVGIASNVTVSTRAEPLRETEGERSSGRGVAPTNVVFWLRGKAGDGLKFLGPGVESIWGVTAERMLQEPDAILPWIHPDDRARARAMFSDSAAGGWDIEYRVVRQDGQLRRVRDHGIVVQATRDGPIAAGMWIDITGQKLREGAVRKVARFSDVLVDEIPALLALLDAGGKIRLINKAFEHQLGWSVDELAYIDLMEEGYPDPEYRRQVLNYLAESASEWKDFRIRTRAGKLRDFAWSSVRLADGGSLLIAIDMHERSDLERRLRESETKFRSVYESNAVPFMFWHAEGHITGANDAYLQLIGYTREQFESGAVDWKAITPEEWRERDARALAEYADGAGVLHPYEKELLRADGTRIPVLVGGAIFSSRDSGISFALDLSDRKRAEIALREEKEFVQRVIDASTDVIFAFDAECRVTLCNAVAEHIAGKPRDRVLGSSALDVFPFLRGAGDAGCTRALSAKRITRVDIRCHPPSVDCCFDAVFSPMCDSRGDVVGGVAVLRNVAIQKRTEEALRLREQEFETVVENSPDIIDRVDRSYRHVYVNRRIEEVTGIAAGEFIGKSNRELGLVLGPPGVWESTLEEIFHTGKEKSITFRHVDVAGKERMYDWHLVPECDRKGNVTTVLSLARDTAGRARMEDDLRKREREYLTLAESAPDIIMRFGMDGRNLFVNRAGEALLGLSRTDIIGKTNRELTGILEFGTLWDAKKQVAHELHETQSFEFRARVANEDRDFETRIVPEVGDDDRVETVLSITRDITEEKRSRTELWRLTERLQRTLEELRAKQQQIVQAEKLSALGTLAAGVAHELNNPMMGAMNYVEYAHQASGDSKVRDVLSRAMRELVRMRDLLQSMLAFASPAEQELKPLDAAGVLEAVIASIAQEFTDLGIELRVEIEPGLPQVRAKEGQLRQILINILANARDALEHRAEKKVVLRGYRMDGQIVLEIHDNGPGIPEPLQTRIFDPFFTTKPPGKGTGLGLSIARTTVLELGGDLRYSSEGEGATFVLTLPAFEEGPLS